jgi:DNA-binding NarL/FixJ family response regulator
VDSYYQETGRAGRDGAPARCLLLFSPGDIPKLRHFIDRISDDGERAVALEKLRQMAAFASHKACRRRQLLAFFGESYPAQSCGACDVCAGDVEEMDVTTDAQILMSAVMRTSQRFGGGHITDVVMGADTDRIRDLGHNNLKTYGVGKGKDRAHWRFLINELLAQGALVQDGGQYPVLKLTGRGLNILYGRERITALRAPGKKKPAHGATKSTAASEPSRAILAGAPAPPARGLFERLRRLRRSLAEAQGVPPYIIFSDKTLIEMSGRLPVTFPELSTVSGVGEIKLRRYGEAFLREIEAYLAEHPEMRRRVDTTPPGAQGALDERGQSVGVEAAGRAGDATAQEIVSAAVRKELREKPPKEKKKKGESLEETWELLRSGLGIEEIAARRGLVPSTIATHVELLIIMGRPIHLESFVSPEKTEMIEEAFRRLKSRELKAVFEDLGGSAEYWEIRLVRAALRRRKDNLGDSGQSPD